MENDFPSEFPSNVQQVRSLSSLTSINAVLTDGSELEIDDVIFCTGMRIKDQF